MFCPFCGWLWPMGGWGGIWWIIGFLWIVIVVGVILAILYGGFKLLANSGRREERSNGELREELRRIRRELENLKENKKDSSRD